MNTMSVAAMTLAIGDIRYGFAARQTVLSVLEHTDFEIHVSTDTRNLPFVPRSERVHVHLLEPALGSRADPFLAKFDAWRFALEHSDAQVFLHLDADAVVTHDLVGGDITDALGPLPLAMVEQTSITGSSMNRHSFREHYLAHSHLALAAQFTPPRLNDFRFFNSGVVMFRPTELRNFLDWATSLRNDPQVPRHLGEHMIADQDYLQVWANVLRPGDCAVLDWSWNHCKWWDTDYLRDDARIVHLSNFCEGPPLAAAVEMARLRGCARGRAPHTSEPEITFVIVTHDSDAVLQDCLASAEQVPGSEIIVFDNGSHHGPPTVADHVTLIENERNEGFARGANLGAARARSPVVCFVNPDCIVTTELASEALATVTADPTVAVVPDYVHGDGVPMAGVRHGYTKSRLLRDVLEGAGHHRLAERVAPVAELDDTSWSWPLAACMFVDRQRFLAVGGFDETYLCYMEDVEFGLTWHRSGGRLSSARTVALHLGGRGSAISEDRRRRLLTASRITYARRHHGVPFALFLMVVRALLMLTPRTRSLHRADRR